jgi:hypothetical protein
MNSNKRRVLERVETHYLSLSQLSACTRVDETIIVSLIESDILCPQNDESENWLFIAEDLSRLTRANRLMHEFELTPVGLALVFDLLDELRDLRDLRAR